KSARENDIPALGLCLGMQLMVIEFSRNVLEIEATSGEFDEQGRKVIKMMDEQEDVEKKGGTMRLGGYQAKLNGRVKQVYGEETVTERHRHRYEVDPELVPDLESKGLKIEGWYENLPEFSNLEENSFYIGTQAHPEFNSTFENPSPLFVEFLKSV
ncbi:MAG: gamma-glutamyl-gamma-aminobutyrate hydrolase family protein, partial [Candidatus Nanohaloarchaea archaeon]